MSTITLILAYCRVDIQVQILEAKICKVALLTEVFLNLHVLLVFFGKYIQSNATLALSRIAFDVDGGYAGRDRHYLRLRVSIIADKTSYQIRVVTFVRIHRVGLTHTEHVTVRLGRTSG